MRALAAQIHGPIYTTMKKLLLQNFSVALSLFGMLLLTNVSHAQIASEGFNNSSTLFTITGGTYYTGNSATGDRPASSPFAVEGTHSYGISNGTATLTSSNINTSGYTGIALSFRLACYSIASTGNGAEVGDTVTIAVSPDGGTTYYNTLVITGNNNAYWDYTTGTGLASTAYDGNTTAVIIGPNASGAQTTEGYSTVTVTNLPALASLRIKITMLNNANGERWLVDNFTVTGTVATAPEINLQGNTVSIASGDVTPDAADHTDFGSVLTSSGNLTRTFTIQNTGTANLTVGAITFSGAAASDYSLTTPPASSVAASGSTTFVVTLDPSVVGVRNATISIVNNDSNENPYTFALTGTGTADTATPDWANLQFPTSATIDEGGSVTVYAQVFEPGITDAAGQGGNLQAWIGYSSANTDPSTGGWTWLPATYFGDVGNNDEYSRLLGPGLTPGTYYYSSRFQIGTGPYAYGGTSGLWNNNSAVLTVNSNLVDFANIQSPAFATITQGASQTVYAQVYEPGVTEAAGQGAGITAWIGTSATNSNPNTASWTWTPATFNVQAINNDEYQAAIGSALAPGTYYYASRFQKTGSTEYRYGGTGGNWNTDSGVLTVLAPQEINVQGNNVTIADADATPSATDHTDFGTVALGGNIVRTFTIQNTGGVNLVLDNPAVVLDQTDSFAIISQPASPVAPGGSTTFQIRYTPTTTAADSNTVFIGSNDSDEGVYSFDITGSATINTPVATTATSVTTTSFIANWNAVPGATGYRLDVATNSAFSIPGTGLTQGFDGTTFPPTGWLTTGWTRSTTAADIHSGAGAAVANSTAGTLTMSAVSNPSALSFYLGRSTNVNPKTLTIEVSTTSQTSGFTPVATFDHNNVPQATYNQYNVDLSAYSSSPTVYIRFVKTSETTAPWRLDDIVVTAGASYYVSPYQELNVNNVTSYIVNANLTAGTTYYYRVRAVSGATSANSNPITVTTDPTSVTWNGTAWSNVSGPDEDIDAIIAGAYDTADNGEFIAKTLTINSGSMTISSGTDVTIRGTVNNNLTAAEFVIENNANLIQTLDLDNDGQATVHRDSNPLMRLDYTLWSSPVSGQNLLAFSPATIASRFYIYNPATDLYNSIAPSTNNFAEGTGYLIRMPDNHPATPTVWNGVFAGTLHNGNVNIPVTSGTFNAVGNPYPSTIDADVFIDANDLTEALYFWRKTNAANTTAYATYTLAGGAGTDPGPGDPLGLVPNGVIQVGQGFIAKATSANIGFTNAMRIGDNANQFFRSPDIERNRIWLNLTNDLGVYSQTMVAYMTGATQGIDSKIDGLYFNDSQTALTSILAGNEYAVQGRALPFDMTDVVPLGFKVETAGNYTISIDHTDGLFADGSQEIFLKDNQNGLTHDLREGNYTFASEAGVFNQRFEIVYQPLLSTSNPVATANLIVAYKQGQDIVINSGNQQMASVKIYDLRGRLLAEQNNVNSKEVRMFAGSSNQMLVVKITTQNGSEISKKVIN